MNVEQRIRDLDERLKALEYQDLDLNGRRAINAGRAVAASDLVTLGQARALIASPESTKVLEQRLETVGGGPFGIPVSLGDTNQQGSSSLYADAQHVHASNLTTKGDLLTYSTTTTRLGVGTTGEQLYALSSATPGIAWGSGWKGAKSKTLTAGGTTSLFEIALPTLTHCGGVIHYLYRGADNSSVEGLAGSVHYVATQVGGAYGTDIIDAGTTAVVGGPTLTFNILTGVNKITVRVDLTSGILTPTTTQLLYFLSDGSAQVVTFL